MRKLHTKGLTGKRYNGVLCVNDNLDYFLQQGNTTQPVRVGIQKGNYKQLYIPTPYHKGEILIREHRLLAFNFCDLPQGFDWANIRSYEVHHVDGNKLNNNIRNLQILHKAEHSAITAAEQSYTVDVTTLHDNQTYTFTGLNSAAKFCNSSSTKLSRFRNGGVLTGKGVYVTTYPK